MKSSDAELLIPIYRLAFASVTVATLGFYYLGSVSSDRVLAEQNKMQAYSSLISQAPATTATVTIEGFQFQPNNIQIKQGGKVTFVNKDNAPHTATPDEGAKFTGTGRLAKGESKTVVFDATGVQNYFCEIHPSMKGKITVVK